MINLHVMNCGHPICHDPPPAQPKRRWPRESKRHNSWCRSWPSWNWENHVPKATRKNCFLRFTVYVQIFNDLTSTCPKVRRVFCTPNIMGCWSTSMSTLGLYGRPTLVPDTSETNTKLRSKEAGRKKTSTSKCAIRNIHNLCVYIYIQYKYMNIIYICIYIYVLYICIIDKICTIYIYVCICVCVGMGQNLLLPYLGV